MFFVAVIETQSGSSPLLRDFLTSDELLQLKLQTAYTTKAGILRAVVDLETGSTTLTPGRIQAIQAGINATIPVILIKP